MAKTIIKPPQSWRSTEHHWKEVLSNPFYRSLAQVMDSVHHAVMEFFKREGLQILDMPVTTGTISSPMGLGSDSKPVKIDLLGQPTYLADSMQFMLELGCRLGGKGAAYKAISFRGEDTDARHLAQFQHAECEIPGALEDIITLANRFVFHLSLRLLEACADAVCSLAGGLTHLESLLSCQSTIPRVTMAEAICLTKEADTDWVVGHPVGFELLTRAGEEYVTRIIGHGLAVWVTHFPAMAVPFYQALDSGDPTRALTADLVLGGCEVVGSGQRHLTGPQVQHALCQHGVDEQPYRWYMEMRDLQPLQTSGFGLGIERFLMWALQQADIRDCTLLYRENGRPSIP